MSERTIGFVGGALLIVAIVHVAFGLEKAWAHSHPDNAWAVGLLKIIGE